MVEVELECHEGTSVCPVTGQPDFWTVLISYQPGDRCLESKSLKLYLQTFRDEGIFVEKLADMIAGDVDEAIHPVGLTVTVEQSIRGGIGISATAQRGARL